ncbi:MAG: hypothetical protein N2V76_08825 [Methanophagales archaeon]|nr:hypothetical protein [Methanophagales archaeon]
MQDCTDHHQLQLHVRVTKENGGNCQRIRDWRVNNGYFCGMNLHCLEEKGLDGYIPDREKFL